MVLSPRLTPQKKRSREVEEGRTAAVGLGVRVVGIGAVGAEVQGEGSLVLGADKKKHTKKKFGGF